MESEEESIPVLLQLGTLMTRIGVFHGQFMQVKLGLNLVQLRQGGILDRQPDEDFRLPQQLAELTEFHIRQAPGFLIGLEMKCHGSLG